MPTKSTNTYRRKERPKHRYYKRISILAKHELRVHRKHKAMSTLSYINITHFPMEKRKPNTQS
jgi:hypothetical protein